MYAVIFKALASKHQDSEYSELAKSLRQLAFDKYGCLDFFALEQGDREVTISYWPDEASILAWKRDATHQAAQSNGREKWYDRYTVEVVEIKRSYKFEKNEER
jgi:heme-degrading monooxygenase HmoA